MEQSVLKDILTKKKEKYEKKVEEINKTLESIGSQKDKQANDSILEGIKAIAYLADDLIPIPEDIQQKLIDERTDNDPFTKYRMNTPIMTKIRDEYLVYYEQKTNVGKSFRPEMDGTFTFYFKDGWQVIVYIHVEKHHEEDDGTITILRNPNGPPKQPEISVCVDYGDYPKKFEDIMKKLEANYTSDNFNEYKTIFGLFRNKDSYFHFLSDICYCL